MQNGAHYDAHYFDNWQSSIGAFGGIANQFKFREFIKPTDNVIDFGSGGGYLLKNINCSQRLGIEINPVAREAARLHGIESVASPEEAPDNFASVIVSNHALEHVQHPLEMLIRLKRKLISGGRMVFVVPFDGPNEQYHNNDVNRHLYTWSPRNFGNLFDEAGYKVLEVVAFQHQWPPHNYVALYQELGEEGFHKACGDIARQNNNFQIRAVVTH